MPKHEKSIGVSKETLELLKSYKKEFGASSLDEAIKNAVQWARLWNYVSYKTRKHHAERLSSLEFEVARLSEALKNI